MVEGAEVQQAAVTLHLRTLKAAGDAGQIIFRVRCTLQNSPFVQIQLHVAVEPQSTGQAHTRREVNTLIFRAIVDGFLQGGGVHGLAITHGEIGSSGHIQPVLDGCSADGQFADATAPPLDEQCVLGFRVKILQRKVGLGSRAYGSIIPQNCIGFHRFRCGRLLPGQGDGGIGTAGGQTVLREIVFQHKNSFNSSTSKCILSLIWQKVHINYFRRY